MIFPPHQAARTDLETSKGEEYVNNQLQKGVSEFMKPMQEVKSLSAIEYIVAYYHNPKLTTEVLLRVPSIERLIVTAVVR